jgi:beta-glucanase (GH16 family)
LVLGCVANGGGVDERDDRTAESVTSGASYVVVARHSGKALDVTSASTADGANVQQWVRNGTDAQTWRFDATGDGYYVIRARASGKALDVAGAGTGEGVNVQQWSYWGGANQQWKLEDAGDGYYRIRARNSGKYLDVAWGSTADGANVAQVNWYASAAQQWKLVPIASPTPTPTPAPTPAPAGWKLVWSDEFDGGGLPADDKWTYDVGGSGWGNGEAQYYTDHRMENARVEGGKLVIEARRESYGGMGYTSARLLSRNAGNWLYGRVVVRAKIPGGRGTWPAIWMLPTDWAYGGWPDSGEIDIMEHDGFDPGVIHGTVHTKAYNHILGTQKTATRTVPDAMTAFHDYTLEWSADRIDVFVDDARYFTFTNEHTGSATWPFDRRFHLILNIAVGGSWGAVKGIDDAAFPQRMEVDYVRVYQK